ncbi:hypothetical protein QTI51_25150 [Variovorax sp. J22G73]|jgi:hypothetical protein|uniref:hypothetical protein n=1 Tax=unclassified Variovorax TaxID=663243 RepID=UPI000D5F3879|nr:MULTISPECIES: hypothetical protein [unclassified Variovorax]MDM0007789.1 hypothetical protein [Variovorax sp. J22R203]MDM0100588.1 hypothetical protein [Variovorax sp. J22G73]
MTHTCPRCKQPGIGGLAKRWSSRAVPAKCTACGGLSHVLASTTSGIWAAGVVLFVASLIGGVGLPSGLFFCCGLVLMVACNVWAWRRAKMYPISEESASGANKANWLIAGVAAFFGLL